VGALYKFSETVTHGADDSLSDSTTITPYSIYAQYATFTPYNAALCNKIPTITLSPTSASGDPGQMFEYTVKTVNNDDPNCKPAVFDYSWTTPSGWDIAGDMGNITIKGGESYSSPLVLIPPAGASAGDYPFTETVINTTYIPSTRATANGIYTVIVDDIPPTVSITSPLNEAVVDGNVTISATASDNKGVSKVEFYINNVLKSTSTSSPYNYIWNTATYANGTYSLMVKAYDAKGNVLSSSASVILKNLVVSFISPLEGSTIKSSVTISVSATGSRPISKVEIYFDGKLLSTLTKSPYTYKWSSSSVKRGLHTISAKAYDSGGNTSSALINVYK
jgi:hypothetical protein